MNNNIQYINIISICPYCSSKLIIVNHNGIKILKCPNENCNQRLTNKIEHFCSKAHGLNIKGLGKQTISLLCDWGWLVELGDIFKLDRYKTDWISKTGFGRVSVEKILDSINTAKKECDLSAFISAIGIPLVGKNIAKEIVKYYDTWDDFRNAVGGDWTEFEGFGPELNTAINNFDYTEADEIAAMLDFKQPMVQIQDSQAAAINGKTFCTTGKLTSGQFKNRDELKADIELHGGKMVSSMSSKVDYLITNTPDSGTAKNKKAQELGIKIITEEEYLNMR